MPDLKRILCPIDFSAVSVRALAYAMLMAKRYGAKLRVIHVMAIWPPSPASTVAADTREMAAHDLTAAVERAWVKDVDVSTALIESADPARCIIEAADAFGADLVVTGSHGRIGVERVVLGSVVESLLHRIHRLVLALPSHVEPSLLDQPSGFSRIVCAIDFSEASVNASRYALAIAAQGAARLTLLHVIEVPPELRHHPEPPDFNVDRIRAEAEAECLTRLRTLIPDHARECCTIETAVLEGGVSRQLLRMASDRAADLIVLGVHGRNAFNLAFFGSNSKDVVRQAHCPVLIVPVWQQASMSAAS